VRIGFVIYGSLDTVSGGFVYDRMLIDYLRRHGDTVEIISLPWRNYASNLADNLLFRLPRGFDLIIEDELTHPSLISANSQRNRRDPFRACPVISLVHNLRSCEPRAKWANSLYRAVERRYLESVDGFIFNSRTTRDAVQGVAAKRRPNVIVTPGGDRLGSLDPKAIVLRANEPGPLRVLFLANVTPLKGLHVLLQAVSAHSSGLKLDVVGSLEVDPRYAREMQRLVLVRGLSSIVTFHGVMKGEALVERLEKAQVLVVPSSYEGFGISYLEGMAFGLPAIGTAAGAIPGLIADGQNGYLIAPNDSVALARLLSELVSDRAVLRSLSLGALRYFQSQPTWDQSFGKAQGFLNGMVSAARVDRSGSGRKIASAGPVPPLQR
jgi:glycosyltransferase involved in cell wall biosynthesis